VAVHFAYWLAFKKKNHVLLIDADAQRSSSLWLEAMEQQISYEVVQTPDDLLEVIPELVANYDQIVVDGPASLAEATRAILFRADLAVVPVKPTGVDLRSAKDAIRLIKQAQSVCGCVPVAGVFLSGAFMVKKLTAQALAIFGKIPEATLLKTVIHQKQVIADTSGQSATVWEFPGHAASSSAREYERLFKEISGMSPS
jgi:chromosome partitioning protein